MCAKTIGKPDLHRLRVAFGKDGRLAHLGHLELINTIERSVRRAGLPFSVGNGFARRMRVQFSQALPVGAASACEYYDLYLTEPVGATSALAVLRTATPSALAPTAAAYVAPRLPALEAWLTRARWEVRLLGTGDGFGAEALEAALRQLRRAGRIDFMRGDKPRSIGLAETLVGWQAHAGKDEGPWRSIELVLETRSSNRGALRPAVLLDAAFCQDALVGCALDSLRVVRTGQWHEDAESALVEPLDEVCLR